MHPGEKLSSEIAVAKSAKELIAATRRFYRAADANADGAAKARGLAPACREGCALCCVFRVEVRAHEVFAIAEHIDATFSADAKTALIARLEKHAQRVKQMAPKEHEATNVPCPLLVDSRCSVYPVRPFGCRRHHSTDLGACQYSHDNPKDLDFPGARDVDHFMLWNAMIDDANGRFEVAGLDAGHYELGTALLAALRNSAAIKRWRDGKNPLLAS
jgi:hypothetical protein